MKIFLMGLMLWVLSNVSLLVLNSFQETFMFCSSVHRVRVWVGRLELPSLFVNITLCQLLFCIVHAAVNIIPDRFCSALFMSCKNHTPPVSALCSSHPPHVNLTYLTGITALNPASWTPEINMKLIYYHFLLILSALSHPGFLTSLLVPFHLRW